MVYYGLTSLSQNGAPLGDTYLPITEPEAPSHPPPTDLTGPAFAPLFQALATSKHVSVAPELGDALLACYFSMQISNLVQRSIFLRDMALGGPFFSPFLLMTIYASATRMIDGLQEGERQAQGDLLTRLAREMLSKELDKSSNRITTIQGLMLMSGRECAVGHVSQGWIYAGLVGVADHSINRSQAGVSVDPRCGSKVGDPGRPDIRVLLPG